MAKEIYPLPKAATPLKLVSSQETPEWASRDEYEESVFRRADHFNVVRYTSHNGSQITTVKTFPEAIYLAHEKPRHLIYAVVSMTGEAFCISPKDHERWAEVWLGMPRRTA